MKRVIIGACLILGVAALCLGAFAAVYQPTIRPNTVVGTVEVGSMSPREASQRVEAWWDQQKAQKLDLQAEGIVGKLPQLTPAELGVQLDSAATMSELPREALFDFLKSKITGESYERATYRVVLAPSKPKLDGLASTIHDLVGDPHPASIQLVDDQLTRSPEIPQVALDVDRVPDAAIRAIQSSTPVQLPLKAEEKHVPDAALTTISSQISEFSTRFPAYNLPRCSNIKLASQKLNGVVLMPGDHLSFNDIVGERTLENGFRLAGVYKNGKHDTGIGGGICQVSTTLYNASLLANLRVVRRSNHSLPVAYVPLGRDATVDYGNLDLEIENNYQNPIGIVSQYESGRLTFRVFGTPDPDLSVKITTRPGRTDGQASDVKYVSDPQLPAGVQKIIDPGTIRRSVLTFREVFRAGKLVRTQSLGPSYYGGGVRVIAVGTGKAPAPLTPASLPKPIQPVGYH